VRGKTTRIRSVTIKLKRKKAIFEGRNVGNRLDVRNMMKPCQTL
jgi:hypothetical protein